MRLVSICMVAAKHVCMKSTTNCQPIHTARLSGHVRNVGLSMSNLKVKRMYEMSELERAVMLMVWGDVKELPNYDSWRKYERGFKFEGKDYIYKCRYRVDDGHLRLLDAKIEYAEVTIDIIH
jgi:hypothetical protein